MHAIQLRETTSGPHASCHQAEDYSGHCADCRSHRQCWPAGSPQILESHWARKRIERGQTLFGMGDPFHNLYAVRSGTFKTRTVWADGSYQIRGFPMSGDLLGIDAIAAQTHRTECIALENSEVCVLPYHQLLARSCSNPRMVLDLHAAISREFLHNQTATGMLGNVKADDRVLAFLSHLSVRMRERGFSASKFLLRMTREEIASFLGLKHETVSRAFTRLQSLGHVRLEDHRHVTLLDTLPAALLPGAAASSMGGSSGRPCVSPPAAFASFMDQAVNA